VLPAAMNAEANRLRPAVSALRAGRQRLRPSWEAAAATEERAAGRLSGALRQYHRDSVAWQLRQPLSRPWRVAERAFYAGGRTVGAAYAAVAGAFPAALTRAFVPRNKSSVRRRQFPDALVRVARGSRTRADVGVYDSASVPWRGDSGAAPRGPKGWSVPDQPWPTGGAPDPASGGGGAGRTIYASKVRYERT